MQKIKKKVAHMQKNFKKVVFSEKNFLRPGLFLSDFYPLKVGFSKKHEYPVSHVINEDIVSKRIAHRCQPFSYDFRVILSRWRISWNWALIFEHERIEIEIEKEEDVVATGGGWRRVTDESRSFENSYIPENPRTPKPLTFSKNRLRGAKNRSNISPVAKKNFRKNDFFFSENFAYVQKKNLCICAQSLYNTYLKRFVKKNLKKKRKKKKSCTYAQKIKKSCTYAKVKKKYRFFGNFFQRIVMIKNVLEGSEVGFLKGITRERERERVVQMRTIIGFENGGTNLGHLFDFAANQFSVREAKGNKQKTVKQLNLNKKQKTLAATKENSTPNNQKHRNQSKHSRNQKTATAYTKQQPLTRAKNLSDRLDTKHAPTNNQGRKVRNQKNISSQRTKHKTELQTPASDIKTTV
ncbi:hypothetical protein LXL04_014626 [Taraxacum kok-saghyz]